MTDSPWRVALGSSFAQLDPGLRAYFSTPPVEGGRGEGVFEVVGTPRRWLWPALALLALDGVLWPVWQHEVPFAITNRWADGVLRAERTFRFPRGARTMVDAIVVGSDRTVVDRVGRHGIVEVPLRPEIVDGALVLNSVGAALRLGRLRIRAPRRLAPRVRIEERSLPDGEQHVSFTLDAPGIGRLYEYAGRFRYRGGVE